MAVVAKPTKETLTTQASTILAPEQALALFDQEARAALGLSAQEFLERWDAGEYRDVDDTPAGRKIAYLLLLIPFARQHS